MTNFLDKHTFCAYCGLKVTPGVLHDCKKNDGAFTPLLTETYWCAWCQTKATPIAGNRKTTCSNCGYELHGVIANRYESVMHHPPPTTIPSNNSWSERTFSESSFMPQSVPVYSGFNRSSFGGFNNSSFGGTNTYNPIRNSSTYYSGNAWDNLSANVYDMTH